jgi:hypothetical protein
MKDEKLFELIDEISDCVIAGLFNFTNPEQELWESGQEYAKDQLIIALGKLRFLRNRSTP